MHNLHIKQSPTGQKRMVSHFMLQFRPFIAGALLSFIGLPSLFAFTPQSWQKISDLPVSSSEIRSTLPHPMKDSLLLASENRIFEKDAAGKWREIWRLPGMNNEIRKMVSFPEMPGTLFALTREGVFMGTPSEKIWRQVFTASGPANEILSFTVLPNDPDHWFAGTVTGLFESDNAGKKWDKLQSSPRAPVTAMLFSDEKLFTAFGHRLFVSNNLNSFKPVLGISVSASEPEESFGEETLLEESVSGSFYSYFNDIASSSASSKIWIASEHGVFETADGGNRWSLLSSAGLRSKQIRHLAVTGKDGLLCAAAEKEIYVYSPSEKRWQQLFKGISPGNVYGLAAPPGNNALIALTSSGIHQISIEIPSIPLEVPITLPSPEIAEKIQRWILLEPSAREVQKDVVRYGNLKNGKINRWHTGSRLAALLPSLSFGKDFSIGNNIDIDRGSTSDRDSFIAGPDDTNRGWDFDVSWDLGDFIYSTAQTSIDSREKIMVEFRHEMTTEVTRLYYERRRMQSEWANTPPQNPEEHADLMLRIDELTALIDGMTGGQFSRKLERVERKYPELKVIWDWESGETI